MALACAKPAPPPAPRALLAPLRADAAPLVVPRAAGPLACDGKLTEPSWRKAARTGAFLAPGSTEEARPHSDARLLWDGEHLALALYAADEDLRTSAGGHDSPGWLADAFSVRLFAAETFAVDVAASGAVTDARVMPDGALEPGWESGANAGVERDGTPDAPGDRDEEWVVELALPLKALGVRAEPGATIGVRLGRCDTLKHGERRCGEVERVLTLAP